MMLSIPPPLLCLDTRSGIIRRYTRATWFKRPLADETQVTFTPNDDWAASLQQLETYRRTGVV